jgi:hypothetical protein
MKRYGLRCCALFFCLALIGCAAAGSRSGGPARSGNVNSQAARNQGASLQEPVRNPGRLIHVIVALCDNEYQGIVPVPAAIGNGDDPARNLYWGAGYGVKNHFRKAKDWELVLDVRNPKAAVLERAVFKHKQRDVYLVADAYRGREIMRSTIDFLRFASGRDREAVETTTASKQVTLYAGGAADLIVYVGHDGLMDFTLPEYPLRADERSREAVILACASKPYFKTPLMRTGATPLLWTTGLMAPEAYVLKAAVDGWMLGESGEQVRRRAAEAYNRYQNCGIKGAMRLFATGW